MNLVRANRLSAWGAPRGPGYGERCSPLRCSIQADRQALPSGSHAERPVQGSRRQEYWAADAGGPRAEQAGKVEARLLLSRSEGGTVARAGGNTCAPLSAHVGSLVGNRTLSRAPNDRFVTHMRHQRRWSKPHLYWTGMNGSGNTGRTRACHRRAYSNLDAWAARAPSRPSKKAEPRSGAILGAAGARRGVLSGCVNYFIYG